MKLRSKQKNVTDSISPAKTSKKQGRKAIKKLRLDSDSDNTLPSLLDDLISYGQHAHNDKIESRNTEPDLILPTQISNSQIIINRCRTIINVKDFK